MPIEEKKVNDTIRKTAPPKVDEKKVLEDRVKYQNHSIELLNQTVEELRQRVDKLEGGKPSKPIFGYFNHRGMG